MTRKLLLLMMVGAGLWAAELTQGERDRAMSELHASRKGVEDAIRGLSKAQLTWKAAPERWSIAECVEHLAESEQLLFSMAKAAADGPADPNAKPALTDEALLKMIRNRDQKAKAPEPLVPKARFASAQEAYKVFEERRIATIAYVQTTKAEDMRLKVSPTMKMDSYQVFLLLAAHAQRHTAQMLEVKATPGFPAK